MNVKELDIDSTEPVLKDYDRAVGLATTFDDYIPSTTKAAKMAKSIRDPYKLVRRAKAVVGAWGTEDYKAPGWDENAWRPFRNALVNMGFTEDQIDEISRFEIDESLLN